MEGGIKRGTGIGRVRSFSVSTEDRRGAGSDSKVREADGWEQIGGW